MDRITPAEWLDHTLNFDESLSFIKSGGSVIRFVIVDNDESHESLMSEIDQILIRESMWMFTVSEDSDYPFSRPDLILNSLARVLPISISDTLDNLCQLIWKSLGVRDQGIILAHEAAAHLNVDIEYTQKRFYDSLKDWLGRSASTDQTDENGENHKIRSYTRDFSNAIINLCIDLTNGRDHSIRTFENWLQGEPTSARDRRRLGIMSQIRRDNASANLRSLIALCTSSDKCPSILHLDIRAVTDAELFSDSDESRRHTRATRISTYQWMRELIDQTSLFQDTLIIIEAGPAFPDISPLGKGVGLYDALKNRITDDISVVGRSNASAVMVPIGL